jgi:hypothetical protein
MIEPTTAAGKALLEQIEGHNPWQLGENLVAMSAFVFAIEAEADLRSPAHECVQLNIDLTNEAQRLSATITALNEEIVQLNERLWRCEEAP